MLIEYFQLIDRITALDTAARTIRTEALVPESNSIFEGHFPSFPILPGVLLIEAMAQTAGWLVIAVTGFKQMPFLASVKEAKLRRFVTPGKTLSLSATLVHEGSGYAVTDAAGQCDGKAVCAAQITFRIVDFPTAEFRGHMETTATRLGLPQKVRADG